nr:hypothetical protein [Clostridia bacterium]
MKKIICTILCAVLLCTVLVSCSSGGKTAMSYGESEINERMYGYWASQFKEYILTSFSDASDTDAYWDAVLDNGMTMADYADAIVLENVKKNLVCTELFRTYGLKLDSTALTAIESDMNDLIESYGSKAALNKDLGRMGINADILREIYTIQEKISYLYGFMEASGIIAPNDDVLEAYYKEHYARIKYITIVMSNVTEGENGQASYSSLTDEERKRLSNFPVGQGLFFAG